MNDFLKMDIFFFVATAELLVLGALMAFVIWRILKILKYIERIAEIAGSEAENLRSDAAYLRGRMIGALDAMFSFIPRRRKTEKKQDLAGE
jgi:hypothetical protein